MIEPRVEQVISEDNAQPAAESEHPHASSTKRGLLWVSLTALGVVYGDIGTSPLYALRECFLGKNALLPTPANVLGVLSLIFWSLTLVISIKYLIYVMRADNRGEGGILALMALLGPEEQVRARGRGLLIVLGLFGAALLYGDGIITPAISVLSAVEGLNVATPAFEQFVVPITLGILIMLFLVQSRGTAGIGAVFGPIMMVWFLTLAVMGIGGIIHKPDVLVALNPLYGIRLFFNHFDAAFLVLGAVFLVVTGGEALYADMGHFGRLPIRAAWFTVVLPALLLNYFGQGALLIEDTQDLFHPFFHLAPDWALYPLVLLATIATIIASQAVISGAFSLTRQAVQLGYFPRLHIVQTSSEEIGQVYIPLVNWLLMIATLALVIAFRRSANLAAAYGMAISTTMIITTLLAYFIARERWGWSKLTTLLVTAGFLIIDLIFFGANIIKILDGGWLPLLIGALIFILMKAWKRGRKELAQRLPQEAGTLPLFLKELAKNPPVRVPGTAIFMTGRGHGPPLILRHHLEHNQALHQRVILLTVVTEDTPRVSPKDRLEIKKLDQGFYRVIVHFGFMESPSVPNALRLGHHFELTVDPDKATYYVGHLTLIPDDMPSAMSGWRKNLFGFMTRNATPSILFYHLPPAQVVELGIQVEF
ncbi:MAG: potassium transporter Kup [Anaerolineae bacterium]|nr:potassium transporter Kup [Anaerolineae bacterium]